MPAVHRLTPVVGLGGAEDAVDRVGAVAAPDGAAEPSAPVAGVQVQSREVAVERHVGHRSLLEAVASEAVERAVVRAREDVVAAEELPRVRKVLRDEVAGAVEQVVVGAEESREAGPVRRYPSRRGVPDPADVRERLSLSATAARLGPP